MLKKLTIIIAFVLFVNLLHAQESKSVYEQYLDFNLARLQGENAAALDMGVIIVDSVDHLPPKARISFYNSMGKLYEDNQQPERAIPYYEKVTVAVPNYYVAHRALGYIYLDSAASIFTKLSATKKTDPVYNHLLAQYKTVALKAIKHLEIAQACDPSNETLDVIKTLYKNMGDTAALSTLDDRLKSSSKDCLDILSDN